jgi:hypothetical protein
MALGRFEAREDYAKPHRKRGPLTVWDGVCVTGSFRAAAGAGALLTANREDCGEPNRSGNR